MDKGKREVAENSQTSGGTARALFYAERGIKTGHDFANTMSALMADLLAERVSPRVATAVCTAGSKLLRMVEMDMRYGRQSASATTRQTLNLTGPEVD